MNVYFCYDLKAPNGAKAVEIYADENLREPLYTCLYQTSIERVTATCRSQGLAQSLGWNIINFIDGSDQIAIAVEDDYRKQKQQKPRYLRPAALYKNRLSV